MKSIKFKKGYKYQLAQLYHCKVDIFPKENIDTDDRFVRLDKHGKLTIWPGYAWDGPSGPTVDTKNFMRGSLIHDALYQLMREGYLIAPVWREQADKELKKACLEDGMSRLRAWYVYRSVRKFAEKCAIPESRKEIFEAP
jgi:hypothetical protein